MGNGQAQVALGEPRGEGRRSFRCYELEGLMVFVHPQAVMTGSNPDISRVELVADARRGVRSHSHPMASAP